ncbi:imidazole glycerol phosphate synthase subunit HisH [Robiginitalea sp. IMCC43444]|uniref:imidazole glycerol phosphate synthase subunit HisH n=1 Tax=Robiginitalea sp. IMCC43444 TaxID=3459121 RepID=UPI004042C565
MKVIIINYGAGNIQSIQFAFERLGVHAGLSSDPEEIRKADRVIFPGVGEASSAMHKLKQSGLETLIPELKQPVLGICLGMQLMCHHSEEGNTTGLSIFDEEVIRFGSGLKVPQIGWNKIEKLKSPLFKGVQEGAFVYMVHSYYAAAGTDTIASSTYGLEYSAALARDNFYGVQFHPEKSSKAGARILRNFLELTV